MSAMYYVGLDVHQRRSSVCILDPDGRAVKRLEVRGTWATLLDEVARQVPRPFAVCYEASCGYGYPPRKGGEALIHVDWGNDYTLKKPYWVFRQWAAPLEPGMHVVEATAAGGAAGAGVKPTAFLSADGRLLTVHVVNVTDAATRVALGVTGGAGRAAPAARQRTSATEDMAELPPLPKAGAAYDDLLPPHSMTTYRLTLK